jgi:hypothetical protein
MNTKLYVRQTVGSAETRSNPVKTNSIVAGCIEIQVQGSHCKGQ